MEDQDVSVTLKLSQWQVALEGLASTPMPWSRSNGIITEIIKVCREAAGPADQAKDAAE